MDLAQRYGGSDVINEAVTARINPAGVTLTGWSEPPNPANAVDWVAILDRSIPAGQMHCTFAQISPPDWPLRQTCRVGVGSFVAMLQANGISCSQWTGMTQPVQLQWLRDWLWGGYRSSSKANTESYNLIIGVFARFQFGSSSHPPQHAPVSDAQTESNLASLLAVINQDCAAAGPLVQHVTAPTPPAAPHVPQPIPHPVFPHYMVKPAGQAVTTSTSFLSSPLVTGLLGAVLGVAVGYYAGSRR